MRGYVHRHAEYQISKALGYSRVVAIVGPRQSGKTTLASRFARLNGCRFLSLDDATNRNFANSDPDGFLRDDEYAVIDEIQRAPELLLTIKRMVDENPKVGRYLITGSVDLFHHSISPDSLAGRVEVVELMPFSQAEIDGSGAPQFIERVLSGNVSDISREIGRTDNFVERVLLGGYPVAQTMNELPIRQRWLRGYAAMLAKRDLSDVARVNKANQFARLIKLAATASGQLLNFSKFGSQLNIDSKTSDRWLTLLENLFLIRRVPAWHQSSRKRLVKSEKIQFLDSGLLAAMLNIDTESIQANRHLLGELLECFVFSELLKATSLADKQLTLCHYRDMEKFEVDIVLERPFGEVVGIEVKSRATIWPKDFRGLKRLQEISGNRFVCGVVLHDGERIKQMYPGLFAMPIKMLWEL